MADTYWIDVREADEFATGHHPEAVNIPYESIGERIGEVTGEKHADIRVYCRSGKRSGVAKATLESLGFTQVINEGGVEDVLSKIAAEK